LLPSGVAARALFVSFAGQLARRPHPDFCRRAAAHRIEADDKATVRNAVRRPVAQADLFPASDDRRLRQNQRVPLGFRGFVDLSMG
jgi:hypothetical protein